jgi:hypothetical protein
MVVPDSQDGKHISGEAAMDSNERAQDTVPVLDSTAGSNRLIPPRDMQRDNLKK